jgi:uncharacterized membrane protein
MYNQIAGKRLPRIEALSDGVFSIAMTFLVFNLKDPLAATSVTDEALLGALWSIAPNISSFFLSFMTLGIFWTGHSTQFDYLERSDRNLYWLNLFFLMFVALLPFTTSILGSHIENKVAVILYWLNILALGLALLLHWNYAYRKKLLALDENNAALVHKAIRQRIIYAQAFYGLGAALCFVHPFLSLVVIFAIQLNYAFGFFSRKH